MLHVIWSILTGFVVGLVARAVVPGADKMGFIMTVILGIMGSVVGGVLGRLLSKPADGSKFHPAGFFMSVVGAAVVLVLIHFLRW